MAKNSLEEQELVQYSVLSRAQLSFEYLHTNSTTHEFLFGALAELLDNARDASATKINIYTAPANDLRGGYTLNFLDDGDGMDPTEAADIITFGKSTKRSVDSQMIGQYGNGLKSGSMRIGNDFILFTKKGATMTCLMVSRTFHEEEKIEEVIVPMPSFDSQTKKPLAKTGKLLEKQKIEMDLILKYSPYHATEEFFSCFDLIKGSSGTLVVIYNLKLMDNGQPELDVDTDEKDIILSHAHSAEFDMEDGLHPERRSFRAYAAILYADPRMRIYVQSTKVRTKKLLSCLYKPRIYKYASSRFKTRSEVEVKRARHEAGQAEDRAREAESKARDAEKKYGTNPTNKDNRALVRKSQSNAAELRRDAKLKKELADRKQRALKEPKTLNFIFGLNLENRSQDGMFVYNCSRLIKMYQRVGPQLESQNSLSCCGVMGIVDVPYLVLEPTHNKQDFADGKEYRHLKKAMGEYMLQYWMDINIDDPERFWVGFGYESEKWNSAPSFDSKYVKKRMMQVNTCIQCDECLKWRILPFSSKDVGKEYSEYWVCSMNPDTQHNRCSTAEERPNIPEGVLKIKQKTHDDKKQELEEEIRKKQDKLQKLKKVQEVRSAAQVRNLERSREASSQKVNYKETTAPKGFTRQPVNTFAASSRTRSSKSKGRRKPASSESEDDDYDDEFEPVAEPADEEQDEEEEQEDEEEEEVKETKEEKRRTSESQKRRIKDASPVPKKRTRGVFDSMKESDEEMDDISPTHSPPQTELVDKESITSTEEIDKLKLEADIGTKVELKLSGKWYRGEIAQINKQLQKFKIKFEKYSKDKYDKWVEWKNADLKIVRSGASPPASPGSHDTHQEAPTSSTTGTPAGGNVADELAKGYRRCLGFFIPPEYMDKDAIYNMSTQELVSFPLDEFFDHYEKGLKGLVGKFQEQRDEFKKQAESHQSKLAELRSFVSKLLINDSVLKPNEVPDDIDAVFRKYVQDSRK